MQEKLENVLFRFGTDWKRRFFYSFELLMVAQSFTIAKWVFITPDVI